MRIYHYTSIETLALILRNKTIRFSRLDKVDDPDEYSYILHGHNPAKFTYVSCWTSNENENIPQWIMYGKNRHGVRISFEGDIFDIKKIGNSLWWLSKEELEQRNYAIMPILDISKVIQDIAYVEKPQETINKIFIKSQEEDAIDFKEVGLYKSKDWSFQKERRFIFQAFPKNESGHIYNPSYYIENNLYCEESFIDIPIKESAFSKMEILIGPDVNLAEKTIVEALCQKYIGMTNIKSSVFAIESDS